MQNSEGLVKMPDIKRKYRKYTLPLLPLRGLTVFPYMILTFDVGRDKSIRALDDAMVNNQMIFLVAQKDAKNDLPNEEDIYKVGTVSKVKQLLRLPGDTIRVLVEGICRAEVKQYLQTEPFFVAEVVEKIIPVGKNQSIEYEALKRRLVSAFEDYAKLSGKISLDTVASIGMIEDIGQLSDIIAANIQLNIEQKQEIMDEFDPADRIEKLLKILIREIEILEVEKNISMRVRKQIDKMQREYYLREQIKAIQSELGDKEGVLGEVEEYRKKLENVKLPEEAVQKVLKELDRLVKMPSGSAEGSVIRTYLDWIFDLPWDKKTEEIIDLARAQKILEEDHYGLEKVKERIIEYLAVLKLTNNIKGQILCLVGPPGVGKTSIAKSIARALNRNYVRMSLGGVRDEAEIRGHRRTYIGAMPGRIITALKLARSSNPLLLLDEIDKMSSDFRGDPASAMLEVLDSEQNFAFRDHYLELPVDLSNVLFITTANNADSIPKPLLDRMEVITISGYTEDEKVIIARKYLTGKQMKAHGLNKRKLKIDEDALRSIIRHYTREAGVRNLEREIANICRKAARMIVSGGKKSVTVSMINIEKYLGTKRYRYDKVNEKDEVGLATGLAWTPFGGDTLAVEVTLMAGNGKLELTGQLGDVMKESAKAAISFIRSQAEQLNVDKDFHNKFDIHIHVPEGAIPKDGPSAGITLATAMVSALTGQAVSRSVAMTGEITLRGRVLPVGGLKEKVLAAHRAGIDTIVIPLENRKDIDEIPGNVKSKLKFVFAADMNAVLKAALVAVNSQDNAGDTDELQEPMLFGEEGAIMREQNQTHKM